jgi:hypothetical protein
MKVAIAKLVVWLYYFNMDMQVKCILNWMILNRIDQC